MQDVTTKNFGLLIAYVIPGFAVLWAVRPLSPTLQQWLGDTGAEAPTVGGFLYVTLASVATGMAINAVRWLVLDHLHYATGIRRREWDFSLLPQQVAAFDFVNEHQYRHSQHHSAMLIAAATTRSSAKRLSTRTAHASPGSTAIASNSPTCDSASNDRRTHENVSWFPLCGNLR